MIIKEYKKEFEDKFGMKENFLDTKGHPKFLMQAIYVKDMWSWIENKFKEFKRELNRISRSGRKLFKAGKKEGWEEGILFEQKRLRTLIHLEKIIKNK